jgi:hypothetical protein
MNATQRTMVEAALNYINHVGSNWTMRGEPHPQQWIVDGLAAFLAAPSEAPREGATPRTKAQCLTAVVKELGLDTTDPFTRVLAAAFALQDAYDESRAALTRCQQIVHEQAAPGRSEEKA